MSGILTSEDTAREKYIAVARTVDVKAMTRITGKTIVQVTAASLQIWKNRKMNGMEGNKMKIMVAFGIPPSGKKVQILRRTLMPDGNEAELIKKYSECVAEIMCARNVHVIVKEA